MAADYENWVPRRLVYLPFFVAALILGLAIVFPILFVVSLLPFLVSEYFAYARYQFGSRGGKVEEKILNLALGKLDWNGVGRAIDVGCGKGALTIRLAQAHKGAKVIGVELWGGGWEYSEEACERNAKAEGVDERVSFQKASASALPFEDCYFDAAVSNLVFHEVRGVRDKREVVREALRVVKKGGKFAFKDLFLLKSEFGTADELIETIRSWGTTKVEFTPTRDAPFIPRLLKLPFMVGTLAIMSGEK